MAFLDYPGLLACSTTPRRPRARTDSALPVHRRSRASWTAATTIWTSSVRDTRTGCNGLRRERDVSMPKRDDLHKIMIDRLRPHRHRPGLRVRLLRRTGLQGARRAEGYRVVLVNSNPATIMTDPGTGRPHLRRAHHGRVRRPDHRRRSARTRMLAHPGRADGAQHARWSWPRPARSTSTASR